jgi:hypothetical protein
VAYAFAYVMDWLHWLLGWVVQFSPTITRHMVCFCHYLLSFLFLFLFDVFDG